jgi:hypothetical protein
MEMEYWELARDHKECNFMEKMSKLILRRTERAGKISKPDLSGHNPMVLVHGIGQMTLEQLKKEVKNRIQDLAKEAESNNWDRLFYLLTPPGTTPTFLQSLIHAVMDVTAELEAKDKDSTDSKNASLNEMIEIWPDGRYGRTILKG